MGHCSGGRVAGFRITVSRVQRGPKCSCNTLSMELPACCLTHPSSGRFPAGCARFQPPLMSNVRPPRRHMREGQYFASLPRFPGACAESVSGCPSVGGQRTIGFWHQARSQSPAHASESRMAQCFVQRLKGLQRLLPWSLAGAVAFASHRRPNPSVKRTVNGGPRSAVFGKAVPPLSAAYLKR